MRRGRVSYALMCFLLACASAGEAGGSARKADLRTLEASTVRDSIAAAAIRVAASGEAGALSRLGRLLPEPAFLARLDDTTNPQLAFSNLNQVFLALAKNPSRATESVCLLVLSTPTFQAGSDRILSVLPALAAVRPMSAAGAAVFSRTNAEGLFGHNCQLLAANGSPLAMALLETMLADRSHTVTDRIEISREALVPHRTDLATVRLVGAMTDRADLEPELATALIECLYDYHPEWYGKRRQIPDAPPWKDATTEARREAAKLGRKMLASRKGLPERLQAAIKSVI